MRSVSERSASRFARRGFLAVLVLSGCEPLMESSGPGFTYDARQKVFVGWPNAGDTVYLLDPVTKQCTPQAFPGGPPPASFESGTWGRFRYMPELDAFVVVNDIDNDAYGLRL